MRHVKLAGVMVVMAAMATRAMGEPPATSKEGDETTTDCPEAVRGVDVTRKSVDGGVSFKFTTHNKQQLEDLRLLLREAATLIEHHSKLAALHPEQMKTSDADAFVIPAVDIDVKDTPTGAQITVRAEDPAQLGEVRAQAQAFEQFWDKNSCIHSKAAGSKEIQLQQVSR